MEGNRGVRDSSPRVIVDFVFDDGLFFISVKNIGDEPAYKVSIRFNRKIIGLLGGKDITRLPLFKNVEFLAPQREIRTFLDTSASYFERRQPTRIAAKVSYHDSDGKRHAAVINHDLEIYKDIGYIRKSDDRI